MGRPQSLAWLCQALLFSGCASFLIGGQVQSGRLALQTGKPAEALSHFQAAAKTDPNYAMTSGLFREGIWTYVGRAQYHMGRFAEARQSLERSLSLYDKDYLAGLYLGLTLARGGDRANGLQRIRGAMQGLYNWIESLTYTPWGQNWDPAREVQSQIEKDLAMISDKDFDWDKLMLDAEWLGHRTEEEIDRARRDERDRLFRDGDDRRRRASIGLNF